MAAKDFMPQGIYGPEVNSATDPTEALPGIYDTPRQGMEPDRAMNTAERYDFALGDKSPGQDEIFQNLIGGYQQEFTERMMNLDRMEENTKLQQRLIEFVNKAKRSEMPLSLEEYDQLVTLPEEEMNNVLSNPDTYFAKKQAKQTIDTIWNSVSNAATDSAAVDDGMKKYLTKQYKLQELLQEGQKRLENESFFTKAINTAELFVPTFSWWNTADAIEKAPTSTWLRGSNLREQADYVWANQDVDATISEVRQAFEEIYENNPYDAVSFLNGILYAGERDEVFDNLMQVGEIATGVTAAASVKAARTFVQIASRPGASVPGMLDASGQVADAAFRKTINELRLASQFDAGAAKSSFVDLAHDLHPIMNPDAVTNAASNLFSVEYKNKLTDILKLQSEAVLRAGLDVVNVARLEPGTQAYNTALQETQRLFQEQFPSTNGAVLTIRPITSANNRLTNTDHIAVALGRTDGTLFQTVGEAQANAQLYELTDFTVAQRGKEYYIEVTKAVDETLPSVRNALSIDTVNNPTPTSVANRMLGAFRTKDELLPKDLVGDLKTATSGAQQFANLLAGIVNRGLSPLRKESRERLVTFLERQRDATPAGSSKPGYFNRDIAEFERDWNAQFGRPPREDETTAYFTYVQVNDAEFFFNNLNIYKGKTRLGFENFHFEKVGVRPKTPPAIEGRLRDIEDFYRFDDDATLLIWDDSRMGLPVMVRKNELTQPARDDIRDMIDNQGYRLVQLSRYGDRDLRKYPMVQLPDAPIQYVLVRNFSSRPLSLKQIPYRGGPHQEYANRFFISQPDIHQVDSRGTRLNYYRGDKNAFAFETREQATRYTEALEEARRLYAEMLQTGNDFFLRGYLSNNSRLPLSFDDFTKMFTNNGGIFNPNIPFYSRTRGMNVRQEHKIDTVFENFRDVDASPHNPFNEDVNLRFAQERDEPLDTIVERGSAQQPYHSLQRARFIDPFVTMNRAIRNVTKGRYLDDLKLKSAERFVREFADVLSGNAEELQRFPMRALMDDSINRNHPNADRVAAARNYKRALIEFFNTRDEDQYFVDSIVNSVGEFLVRRSGDERGIERLARVEPHLIATVKDPTRFFRSIAFYPRMGFWNPKQWFMQAQGVVMTMTLEGPQRGLKAGAVSPLMRPLHMRGSDAMLDRAAEMATSFGWNKDHFKEAYLGLQRTGFQNVGGEYGVLDDFLNPNVVKSGASSVLDNSLLFFREGEKVNRITAWNAAYLRWRETNPLGKFDEKAIKEVLNRADLLTVNMTRASNASWNQGWASIPTQFFSYQARLMDLMLGTRLTTAERARIVMSFSALYGVPLGVLGTTAGILWPWHEESRKTLVEYGIDMDDPAWDAFTNGIPQAALNYISGGEVDPALAATFGPNGLPWLKDLLSGDFVEVAGGPATKTVTSIWSAAWGLARAGYLYSEPTVMGMFGVTTTDQEYLPLTSQDFLPLLNNITSLSNASKAYIAYNTGTYFSKNNVDVIGDNYDNPWNAFFTGILGTNPQGISDFYSKLEVNKDIEAAQESMRKEARAYLRMAYQKDVSDEDRITYLRKAKAAMNAGGLTETQKQSLINQTIRSLNQTSIEQIDNELKTANKERQTRWYEMLKGDY